MPATWGSKSFKLGFRSIWIENLQMYKLVLEDAEKPEIKLPKSIWSQRNQENSRKTSVSASLTVLSLWLCGSQQTGKFLKRHLTSLLRKLYTGQETTVRTGHGTTDWFQIEKGVRQGCILSPCLFNLYAEYIMSNAGLDETQAGIKISQRNINNLRYANDIPLMAESKKELKRLLMKVKKESEKVGLKFNIQKQRS